MNTPSSERGSSLNVGSIVTVDFGTQAAVDRATLASDAPLQKIIADANLGLRIGETDVALVPRGNNVVPPHVIVEVELLAAKLQERVKKAV